MRTKDQAEKTGRGNAERRALWRAAATLGLKRASGKAARTAPRVFFVTDPDRTPDPARVAAGLPRGTGVIFRGFGRPDAEAEAWALADVARRKGLILLIGADERLAAKVGAQGVHLPERSVACARMIRLRHPDWLITGAAHSASALAAAERAAVDAVLVSTAFASRSPTASRPLGPVRVALLVRRTASPVIALGGVNGRTARRLIGTGVYGFAAVEGLASAALTRRP